MMKKVLYIIMLFFLFSCAYYNFNNPNDRTNINYNAPMITVNNGMPNMVLINWTTSQKNLKEYIIYRGDEKTNLVKIASVSTKQNFYADYIKGTINRPYYYAVRSVLEADEKSNFSNIEEGYPYHTIIDFASPKFKAAVQIAINKYDDDIYAGDVASLTTLNVNGEGIFDLNGIEYFTSLSSLYLYRNNIVDISPLSSLKELTILDINANEINDLTPLSSLTGLTRLNLYNNNIDDISPLSTLTNLTFLDISSNYIKKIDALSSMKELIELKIVTNKFNDISVIRSLKSLKILHLGFNEIDITTLGYDPELPELTYLDLRYCELVDIDELSSLTGLSTLNLQNNKIEDISPLVNNTGIGSGDSIDLSGNPLNTDSTTIHIPALEKAERGVNVIY